MNSGSGGDIAPSSRVLLILNDPPYGTERSYNGFRLARSLAQREGVEVKVFLMGDAVSCALAGQKTPDGYYNLERMIRSMVARRVEIGCCGGCLETRAITDQLLVEGVCRSSLDQLSDWTLWADKVVSF
jgi:uncharacterized protein involved in oxidation of intracellular sulfur